MKLFIIVLLASFALFVSASEEDFSISKSKNDAEISTNNNIYYQPTHFISISHGGGPMPLLGQDPELVHQWSHLKKKFLDVSPPDAIIVISAHYSVRGGNNNIPKVNGAAKPSMLYDYGGFPPESYKFKLDSLNDLDLAKLIAHEIKNHPLFASHQGEPFDESGQFDHGTFVPMLGIFGKEVADKISVVPVSISGNDDAEVQLAIGESLRNVFNQQQRRKKDVSDENRIVKKVAILASGSPFHNFNYIFNPPANRSPVFINALKKLLTNTTISKQERKNKLLSWREHCPESTVYQPKGGADHFMPLLSLIAAADYRVPDFVEDYVCFRFQVSDFVWKF